MKQVTGKTMMMIALRGEYGGIKENYLRFTGRSVKYTTASGSIILAGTFRIQDRRGGTKSVAGNDPPFLSVFFFGNKMGRRFLFARCGEGRNMRQHQCCKNKSAYYIIFPSHDRGKDNPKNAKKSLRNEGRNTHQCTLLISSFSL
ncbi:MAG: hypothetical protein ABW019_03155 [Chitinophagaceae bacterium]